MRAQGFRGGFGGVARRVTPQRPVLMGGADPVSLTLRDLQEFLALDEFEFLEETILVHVIHLTPRTARSSHWTCDVKKHLLVSQGDLRFVDHRSSVLWTRGGFGACQKCTNSDTSANLSLGSLEDLLK